MLPDSKKIVLFFSYIGLKYGRFLLYRKKFIYRKEKMIKCFPQTTKILYSKNMRGFLRKCVAKARIFLLV